MKKRLPDNGNHTAMEVTPMRIHLWLVSFLILTLGYACPIQAQNLSDAKTSSKAPAQIATGNQFDVALGVGMLRGDTRYQIGGLLTWSDGSTVPQPDPTSQLIWPLDVYMVHLNADILLADRFKLSLGVKKNIRDSAGDMKDSDWGIYWLDEQPGALTDTLDIYSESSTELDALIWDVTAGYVIYKHPLLSITGLLGYLHEDFDFDASNTTQWYPSYSLYNPGEVLSPDYYNGKMITYEITYDIPYLGLEATWHVNDAIRLQANGGYTPYAMAEDKDHHLVGAYGQGSISKTDADGRAWMYGIHGTAHLSPHWALGAGYDYLKIKVHGDSETTIGGLDGTCSITEDIESKQQYLSLDLQYSF